jgi:O-antigen ligase
MIKGNNFNPKIILYSLLMALLVALLSEYISILLIIALATFTVKDKKTILVIIIFAYLGATSIFYAQYRLYITSVSTLLLIYFFVKEYGIDLSNYKKLPKEIIVFTALLLVTLLFSTLLSDQIASGLTVIVRMSTFLLICYMFYSLLKNNNFIYTYIYAIFLVMLTFGFRMIIDYYILGPENYFIRTLLRDSVELYSSYSNTGLTIFFISISFITAMFFLNRFNSRGKKLILSGLLIINIISLILANSRGGILASVISISFIIIVLKRSLFFKAFVITSLAVTIILLTIPVVSETVDIYLRWHTVGDREAYWHIGVEVIKDNPVFGLGPGMFSQYFYSYAASSHVDFLNKPGIAEGNPHPHNFFLYFFAENGLLGIITSIVFFIVFFYIAIKTMKLAKQNNHDFFVLSTTITGIGLGLFFRSFIEVTGYLLYGFITTDLPFWLIFGILISIHQKFREQENYSSYNYEIKRH